MATLAEKLQLTLDTKNAIKEALEEKGVDMSDKKFRDYPDAINNISGEGFVMQFSAGTHGGDYSSQDIFRHFDMYGHMYCPDEWTIKIDKNSGPDEWEMVIQNDWTDPSSSKIYFEKNNIPNEIFISKCNRVDLFNLSQAPQEQSYINIEFSKGTFYPQPR